MISPNWKLFQVPFNCRGHRQLIQFLILWSLAPPEGTVPLLPRCRHFSWSSWAWWQRGGRPAPSLGLLNHGSNTVASTNFPSPSLIFLTLQNCTLAVDVPQTPTSPCSTWIQGRTLCSSPSCSPTPGLVQPHHPTFAFTVRKTEVRHPLNKAFITWFKTLRSFVQPWAAQAMTFPPWVLGALAPCGTCLTGMPPSHFGTCTSPFPAFQRKR